jgi:hypothetical protein
MRIYVTLFGIMTGELAVYILYHDIGEMGTGDIPSDCKTPELRAVLREMEEQTLREMKVQVTEPSPVDKMKVKLCDIMEFWEFGHEELARGNRFAEPIVDFGGRLILKLAREINNATYDKINIYMTDFVKSMT